MKYKYTQQGWCSETLNSEQNSKKKIYIGRIHLKKYKTNLFLKNSSLCDKNFKSMRMNIRFRTTVTPKQESRARMWERHLWLPRPLFLIWDGGHVGAAPLSFRPCTYLFLEKHLCGLLCANNLEASQHLECTVQEGRDCCLFCSLQSPQHLEAWRTRYRSL